jgi:hypothetical protein
MKRNIIIVTLIALIASACSTSVQMTGRYVDDLYYWPGDAPLEEAEAVLPSIGTDDKKIDNDMLIISEVGKDDKGNKTLDNYIYAEDEPDWYKNVQAQNIETINKAENDTIIIPAEDDGTYIVNNYYLDDNNYYSYSDRIRRFHNPYYYDPFWNNSFYGGWNDPFYSWNYPYSSYYSGWNSWGWDPWYNSWGYSPYCYNSWYGGYNSWYGGYYNWNSPYYSNHQYGHHNQNWNNDNFRRDDNISSNRRSRNPNAVYGGGSLNTTSVGRNNNTSGVSTLNKSVSMNSRRSILNEGDNQMKSASTAQETQKRNGAILTEKRRNAVNSNNAPSNIERKVATSDGTPATTPTYRTPTQNSDRRVNSGSSNQVINQSNGRSTNYVPSYNKPRTNTRATYNTNRTSEPTRYTTPSENRRIISGPPSTENGTKSSYQIPSTNSGSGVGNTGNSYRSRSTSSGSSTPVRSYSSGSSTPTRSYSSGSSSSESSTPTRSYSSSSSSSSGSSSPTRSYSSESSSPSRSSSGSSYTPSSSGSSSGSSYSPSSGSSSGGSRSSSGSSSSGSRR